MSNPLIFCRYTQFAHKYLFEMASLEIEKLEWMEGYLGTVGYKLECIYRFLPVDPRKLSSGLMGWLIAPLIFIAKFGALAMAGVFYRLDCRQRLTTTGFPKNYLIIARKPS